MSCSVYDSFGRTGEVHESKRAAHMPSWEYTYFSVWPKSSICPGPVHAACHRCCPSEADISPTKQWRHSPLFPRKLPCSQPMEGIFEAFPRTSEGIPQKPSGNPEIGPLSKLLLIFFMLVPCLGSIVKPAGFRVPRVKKPNIWVPSASTTKSSPWLSFFFGCL